MTKWEKLKIDIHVFFNNFIARLKGFLHIGKTLDERIKAITWEDFFVLDFWEDLKRRESRKYGKICHDQFNKDWYGSKDIIGG